MQFFIRNFALLAVEAGLRLGLYLMADRQECEPLLEHDAQPAQAFDRVEDLQNLLAAGRLELG